MCVETFLSIYFHCCLFPASLLNWFFSVTFTAFVFGISRAICIVTEISPRWSLKVLLVLELFAIRNTFKYQKRCLCSLEREGAITYCAHKEKFLHVRKAVNTISVLNNRCRALNRHFYEYGSSWGFLTSQRMKEATAVCRCSQCSPEDRQEEFSVCTQDCSFMDTLWSPDFSVM